MKSNLADALQVWGFEEDIVIFSDGSLGFGLDVLPLDVDCLSDEQINGLTEKQAHFLNGLPVGIDIQFVKSISGGNEKQIREHQTLSGQSTNAVAKALTEERIERLLGLEASDSLPKHCLKLFVRKPLSAKLLNRPSIFSKPRLFEKIAESVFERELASVATLRAEIMRGLKSLEMDATPLSSDELANYIYRQWNPSREVDLASFDPEDFRYSVLFTDVSIYEKGFAIGDCHHRVISLKLMPDRTFAAMSRAFLDLPFDSRLFLTISVRDQQKEIEALKTQRRLAFSMARGKREGVSDLESENKFQDLEALLSEMLAQGEKVFHVSLNIVLSSTSKESLSDQVAHSLMKFRELSSS